MPASFQLTVLTQEGKAFEAQVETVTLPGPEGYFGVLAHHAPLVAMLGKGLLTVSTGIKTLQAELEGGFTEVSNNAMTILADSLTEFREII